MSDLVWGDTVLRDEFDRALRLGLGRTVVWLRAHPTPEFRDLNLHACTHNLAFDRQIDGSRHDYLYDLVQASGEPDYYYSQIITALAEPENDEYFYDQMLEMLRLWAEHGHPGARQALYEAFAVGCAREDDSGDRALVMLDGPEGLIYVADQLGRMPRDPLDTYYDGRLFDFAQDGGITESLRLLEVASAECPAIKVFLERVAAQKARDENRRGQATRDPATVSYAEFKQAAETTGGVNLGVSAKAWGRAASESDLNLAAADLMAETDPFKLRRLLQIFWRRPFPFGPDHLIVLMEHPAPRVAVIALGALKALPAHPAVRALALRLGSGSDQMAAYAVGLLAHQFQPGDHVLVEALASRLTDAEAWHTYNTYTIDFYAAHPETASEVRVMLALYENNPCIFCREKMVKRLIALNALPDWMAAECRLDAGHQIVRPAGALTRR